MEMAVLDGPPQRGEDSESPRCEGGHTATWAALHVLGSAPFLGRFGGCKAAKCRTLTTAHHNQCSRGKPLLLELDQNIPFSWQPALLSASCGLMGSTPAHHGEPLPVHRGRALEAVGVSDELVQDADDLGEAGPLAALLLPAVQHELVQGCGAAHRGGQAVAFLHRINDLEGSHGAGAELLSCPAPSTLNCCAQGRSPVHELLRPSEGGAGRCTQDSC